VSTPPGWQRVRREDLPVAVQSAMAAIEGAELFTGMAQVRGADMHKIPGHLPGIAGVWEARIADGLAVGSITPCGHLRADRPVPMLWLAWAPNELNCARCAGHAAQAITGTPADDVCDGCGDTSGIIHVVGGEIPGAVFVAEAASRQAGYRLPTLGLGPLIIQGGLCPPCASADQALVVAAASESRRVEPKPRPGG
jgi:hypothetical protein